jgi:hypothetical protein
MHAKGQLEGMNEMVNMVHTKVQEYQTSSYLP